MNHHMLVPVSGIQHDVGPTWFTLMMNRIREGLRLKAQPTVLLVGGAGLSDHSIEEVSGVELDSGLIGRDRHDDARGRIGEPRHLSECPDLAVQAEVMVETTRIITVRGKGLEVRSDRLAVAEVQGGRIHGGDFSGRNQRGVDRGVSVGVDEQRLIKNRS